MTIAMRQRAVQCISPAGLHNMAYVEWGDPDNRKVLVCVHGLTRCSRDFDFVAQALAQEYRVVCPDVVGRGRSDWLVNKSLYGVAQYAADMVSAPRWEG
jgi:pimeloyl-ACP methyl ester carboxylesterase